VGLKFRGMDAGFFRSRQGQLWQLVLSRSKPGSSWQRPAYRSIRVGPCPLETSRCQAGGR